MKTAKEKWGNLSGVRAGLGIVSVAEVRSLVELQEMILFCQKNHSVLLPIGKGSNLVGSDKERNLTCLRLGGEFLDMTQQGDSCVKTGCGEILLSFLSHCADLGLGGLSALFGIPGTLGGALAGNAGANGHSIFEFVKSAEGVCLEDGTLWKWTEADGGWSYRTSPVPKNVILTFAELRLEQCNSEEEHALQNEVLARRKLVAPVGPSLGSTFRNPDPDQPAGKLLELAGCKNLSSGGFVVSERHANWIVNTTREVGSAKEYRGLVEKMKQRVQEQFGIQLQEEVRFVDDMFPNVLKCVGVDR